MATAFDPTINDGGTAYRPGEREYASDSAARGNEATAARLNFDVNSLNEDSNIPGVTITRGQVTSGAEAFPVATPTEIRADSAGGGATYGGSSGPAGSISSVIPKQNPLGNFSSYTYALSLYMVTPEVMNSFTVNGAVFSDRDRAGIFIVAQSGGINNATEQRAITSTGTLGRGQPGLDFYIDDLNLETFLQGGIKGPSISTSIKFKIIEPIGFSFLTDVAKAAKAVNQKSSIISRAKETPTAFQQCYILGIRFYGYDVNGKVVTAGDPTLKEYKNGFADANSVIERFIPIKFSSIKFKLDERATNYMCEAYQFSEQAVFGQINATIKSPTEIVGGTVGEAIAGKSATNKASTKSTVTSLKEYLNQAAETIKEQKLADLVTTYDFKFAPKSPIPDSKLIDDKDFDAKLSPGTSSTTTAQVNTAKSIFETTKIDTTSKKISIAPGQTISTVLDSIIVKSSYITDALIQTNTSGAEVKTREKPGSKKLQWYSINPVATVKGWDDKNRNWAYEITYEISDYQVEYIKSQYVKEVSKYAGPYKLYNYFFTGLNSEVLSYEQEYNNLYYVVASTSTGGKPGDTKKTSSPTGVQAASDANATSGKSGRGSQINENVRAQLNSIADNAEARIKIMGDPDYIMTAVGVSQFASDKNSNAAFSALYGKDFSINPLNKQMFIQIVFNIASDYQDNGLLDVSDSIQFYDNEMIAKAGIKGLVYKPYQVESVFSGGRFTQTLQCVIASDSDLLTESSATEADRANQRAETNAAREGNTDNNRTSSTNEFRLLYATDEDADADLENVGEFDAIQASPRDDAKPTTEAFTNIYTPKYDDTKTREENSAREAQAEQAAERAQRAIDPGPNRLPTTSSNQRRFTRSNTN